MISASAQNLSWLVFLLLTEPRGIPVDSVMKTLDIAERTYRKYRAFLQHDFPPFLLEDGSSMVREVEVAGIRYLRLLAFNDREEDLLQLIERMAAINLARQMFGFVRGTGVGTAIEDLSHDVEVTLKERQFLSGHLLRNLDRMLYLVPDAPKDYSAKATEVRNLLRALLFCRRISARYRSPVRGTITLKMEPLSLLAHRSALYLLARSAPDRPIRTYAVDRFESVEVTRERFSYPSRETFHPKHHTEGSFGIFQSDAREWIQVCLHFRNIHWLKVYLRERRWHPTQSFRELEDGRLEMSFRVTTMEEVWPWIRRFGEDVEVVAPPGPVPRSFSDGCDSAITAPEGQPARSLLNEPTRKDRS